MGVLSAIKKLWTRVSVGRSFLEIFLGTGALDKPEPREPSLHSAGAGLEGERPQSLCNQSSFSPDDSTSIKDQIKKSASSTRQYDDNMSQPSLTNFILKRPWLKSWMTPMANWYCNAAGYRQLGLR